MQFDEVLDDLFQGVVKKPVIRSFTHGRGKESETKDGEITYMTDSDEWVFIVNTVAPVFLIEKLIYLGSVETLPKWIKAGQF